MRQRRHERVVEQLPLLAAGELSRLRRARVERHLRRCEDCADEAARQQRVAEELAELRDGTPDTHEPPPELLDRLLDQAAEPGLRARAAAPARGAVSGARPGLSVLLALVVLALVAGAVWAGWRLAERFLDDPE